MDAAYGGETGGLTLGEEPKVFGGEGGGRGEMRKDSGKTLLVGGTRRER